MAIQNWTAISVYVGGVNLACNAKSFDVPTVEVAQIDTTSLCDTSVTMIGGLKTASWSASVMQDFDANTVDDLVGLSTLGTEFPMSVAPAGATEGDVAYCFNATQLNYAPLSAQAGELAMANLSGMGTGTAVRGTLMNTPATPVTSTSTTTGVQVGAVPAGSTMFAALHVLSASGTSPTLDVVLQSDDNSGFSSAVSRVTFTQATGITSQWSTLAGAVTDDYWRASYTIGGSASPTFTFALVIGIAVP